MSKQKDVLQQQSGMWWLAAFGIAAAAGATSVAVNFAHHHSTAGQTPAGPDTSSAPAVPGSPSPTPGKGENHFPLGTFYGTENSSVVTPTVNVNGVEYDKYGSTFTTSGGWGIASGSPGFYLDQKSTPTGDTFNPRRGVLCTLSVKNGRDATKLSCIKSIKISPTSFFRGESPASSFTLLSKSSRPIELQPGRAAILPAAPRRLALPSA